ncbi:MAG: DMT family transporter [Myxococcales bacterium]
MQHTQGHPGMPASSHRLYTALALVAFAANSVLCRVALRGDLIDPASFTLVRMLSGAVVLAFLAQLRDGAPWLPVDLRSVAALFAYAAPFSYAYLRLNTGSGALLLFGAVQVTMLMGSLLAGERLSPLGWLGWGLSVAGLLGLSWPGVSAPDPAGAMWMVLAGLAWGLYSLRGRRLARDPLRSTATTFAVSVLPSALLWGIASSVSQPRAQPMGLLCALASGALASGLGYSLWYAALRSLSASGAALLQLMVPLIAAWFGVLLLGESVSARLVVSGLVILGGVALSVFARTRTT